MSRFAPHALRTFALGCTLVLTLAACTPPQGGSGDDDATGSTPSADQSAQASPTPEPEDTAGAVDLSAVTAGVPDGVVDVPVEAVAGAGWSADGSQLLVTTFGSSSCPIVATAVTGAGAALTVELTQAGGAVCTADLAPATTTLPAPAGVDPAVVVTATLGTLGDIQLPAAATPIGFAWIERAAG